MPARFAVQSLTPPAQPVTISSKSVIAGATGNLNNPVSGLSRITTTDGAGQFVFSNIPFNPYRIAVTAPGFASLSQSVEIRSGVGTNLKLVLQIATSDTTVTVEAGGDLVENDSTFHTDVDRGFIDFDRVGHPS